MKYPYDYVELAVKGTKAKGTKASVTKAKGTKAKGTKTVYPKDITKRYWSEARRNAKYPYDYKDV